MTSIVIHDISRLAVAATLALVAACDTGPGESLYDPDIETEPDPVISDVQPPGSALAGVDIVTITGQNFSSDPEDNYVYFGSARGEVVEASASSLTVFPPNEPAEEAPIRVSVIGAENFSNEFPYALAAAAEEFGSIASFEELFGLTNDAEGNLYASVFSDARSIGIIRFAPDGSRTTFVESTFKWDGLAFGPDGMLYTVRGVRAIFRFAEGSAQETWAVIPDNSVRLVAIAFDDAGNAWVGGPNANLYRISPEPTITEYPFEADVTGLVVSGGALFATATRDGSSVVWQFPLEAGGGIGAGAEYADITGPFDAEALSIAATASGELLVGIDAGDPLVIVSASQSAESFYPGILEPPARSLAWGPGTVLYMNRGTANGGAGLIKVDTRREGAR